MGRLSVPLQLNLIDNSDFEEAMPANVAGISTSNFEIDGSRPKRRVIGEHFSNDPVVSSMLYAMRDPKKGNDCGGTKRMKVNDFEGPENRLPYAEHLSAMYKDKAETMFASVRQPHMDCRHVALLGSCIDIGGPNIRSVGSALGQGADNAATETILWKKGGSKAAYSQRYKDFMDALLKPVSSYTLLYEPHLVPTSKIARKKKGRKSIQESVHKSRPEKNLTKKEPQFRSFPKNVRTLTVSGMLDGVAVQYLSASREKELHGIIKGTSYLCGCKFCNYAKEVNAYEFECHAGCKTCHPNNHILLENGKSLHQVVQELKNTPASMLCDAIQTVIGSSLNRKAFYSWKESFEAASRKL